MRAAPALRYAMTCRCNEHTASAALRVISCKTVRSVLDGPTAVRQHHFDSCGIGGAPRPLGVHGWLKRVEVAFSCDLTLLFMLYSIKSELCTVWTLTVLVNRNKKSNFFLSPSIIAICPRTFSYRV